jgi:hypothetical protein
MTECNRYVICYPGGSGGAFLAAALNCAVNNTDFVIDKKLGHCHGNVHRKYHRWFNHGQTIDSFKQELNAIESIKFSSVIDGHYRNIVAIKEKLIENFGYNEDASTKFIKIVVDYKKPNEILFVASMLKRKTNCFPELLFEEHLEQTTNYIKSWYWIENAYTAPQTITLSLPDIFLNSIGDKLMLSDSAVTKINQCQQKYISLQEQLHSDLLTLLHE